VKVVIYLNFFKGGGDTKIFSAKFSHDDKYIACGNYIFHNSQHVKMEKLEFIILKLERYPIVFHLIKQKYHLVMSNGDPLANKLKPKMFL
jgi:hypothetical protein